MTNTMMLRAALAYLAGDSPFGRPVATIPCCRPDGKSPSGCTAPWHQKRKDHKAGKTPLVPWAPYQARMPTEAEWRGWWCRWAGRCNVGCLAGAVSGVLLLDVDCHDPAADGRTTLRQHALFVPETPTVKTPSGGAHAWYAYPAGTDPGTLRNFQTRPQWPGLDGRGDGGFAVLPPSVHANGGVYAWTPEARDLALADAPGWLIDAFRRQRTCNATNAAALSPDELVGLWAGPWTEGQRHPVANRLIGHLLGHGHREADALGIMLNWNRCACVPPKPPEEIHAHVRDLFNRYGAEIPQPALPEEWQSAFHALPQRLQGRLIRAQATPATGAMAGALADALRAGVSPSVAYAMALDTTDGDVETAQGLYGRAVRLAGRPGKEGAPHAS